MFKSPVWMLGIVVGFIAIPKGSQAACTAPDPAGTLAAQIADLRNGTFSVDTCGFLRHLDTDGTKGTLSRAEVVAYFDKLGGGVARMAEPLEVSTFFAVNRSASRRVDPRALYILTDVARGRLDGFRFAGVCHPVLSGPTSTTDFLKTSFGFDGPVVRWVRYNPNREVGYTDAAGNKLSFPAVGNVIWWESKDTGTQRALSISPADAAFLSDFIERDYETAIRQHVGGLGGATHALHLVLTRGQLTAPDTDPNLPVTLEELSHSSYTGLGPTSVWFDVVRPGEPMAQTSVGVRWTLLDGETGVQSPNTPAGRVGNVEVAWKVGRGPLPSGQKLEYRPATRRELKAMDFAIRGGGVVSGVYRDTADHMRMAGALNRLATGNP